MKLLITTVVALFLAYAVVGTAVAQQTNTDTTPVSKSKKYGKPIAGKSGAVAKPKKFKKPAVGNQGPAVGEGEADPPPDQQEDNPSGWIDCPDGEHSVTIEVCDEDGTNCYESTECVAD